MNAADLKQHSLARIMRGELSDSDDGANEGNDQEEFQDEGGTLGYKVEDVYANHAEVCWQPSCNCYSWATEECVKVHPCT